MAQAGRVESTPQLLKMGAAQLRIRVCDTVALPIVRLSALRVFISSVIADFISPVLNFIFGPCRGTFYLALPS